MLKKVIDILSGVAATLIGGIFLVCSFVLSKLNLYIPIDPAWLTIIISGIPLLYLAIWRMIHNPGICKISSALLITIAMFAAIAIGDLFAAGEVAFIMAIGAILEDLTTDRAKKGLKKLISLTPTQARKIVDGKEKMTCAEEICKNDMIRVLPGETIAVDGIIVSGETSVDQSVMTGESLPVDKTVGDDVFSGTINRFGSIDIRATKPFEDSSLKKLIRMVKEAEDNKAPMARIADRVASWLVPVALLISVVTGIITKDIERAVTVLVVFCPCALVLATPTAIMAAIGQATKHGVIIKSGEALEKMGMVDTIAFDKTGTLTLGKLEVCDIIPFDSTMSKDTLLTLTASAEAKSEHPLGKAIVACAHAKSLSLIESDNFKMETGKGIFAEINSEQILCGNEKFILEHGVLIQNNVYDILETLRSQGKASILVAKQGKCIGIIALSDMIRPQTKKVIQILSSIKIKTILLTGDNRLTAEFFAKQVGITNIRAELLPEQKVKSIAKLKSQGKTICMVGDGVNDAPALKAASVSVAMGSMGSDIAVEAADIALMSDDISKLPYLKKLSNATIKTIKFSIALSMLINFLAVLLSVLGVLNPTTGALVHNAGSCFVVLIAALLYDRKFK